MKKAKLDEGGVELDQDAQELRDQLCNTLNAFRGDARVELGALLNLSATAASHVFAAYEAKREDVVSEAVRYLAREILCQIDALPPSAKRKDGAGK